MNLLVTGGTGFLGSALLPLLSEGGHRLRVLARGDAAQAEALGAEVVRAPLQDRAAVRRALAGVEAVFHLAGQVAFDARDPSALYQLHVECTRTLLEDAHAAGVSRFVLASSSGTIGISREEKVHTESDGPPIQVAARWPYYLSKIYQEKTALRFHRDTGLPVVVLNPSLLLGPGDARLSSTDVVFKFLERRVPARPSGGLSFVDVRDAAAAFAAALTRGRPGERYLLGGANLTFADFFARLSRLSGVAPPALRLPSKVNVAGAHLLGRWHGWRGSESPISPEEVEMGEHFFYVDSRKAEQELGFTARDPQETLHATVAWLDRHVRAKGAGRPATVGDLG
ncbi:NAD-dependent epimerase/dehydratase family protein [Anaeromyxobacter diazotrophicus]|uniref:Dihydroflavonol-4-reductase n=1 Tax=Anaeromyxobacter diazotrophicus TaxID=2590199 RepID=A0A7I9VN88_9BACT|nr:NAD-dependent epimerase/dehydratase family protein [Anaeromyxobacter diazotrophicus]GEJ57851.1 dihydroflavonol-4-reductase [Anaeromyxobacter diazotrophicus]